ncbi:hypothetical protein ACJX0J_030652, partial [Zea mays]
MQGGGVLLAACVKIYVPLDVGQPVQGNKDISNSAVTTNYLPYYDIGSLFEDETVFGIWSFYSASNWVSYKAFLENVFSKQAWRQTFYFTQSGRTHTKIVSSADNAKAVWGNTGDTTGDSRRMFFHISHFQYAILAHGYGRVWKCFWSNFLAYKAVLLDPLDLVGELGVFVLSLGTPCMGTCYAQEKIQKETRFLV